MSRLSSLLQERFKQKGAANSVSKVAEHAKQVREGTLSSFDGMFTSSCELSESEKKTLEDLVENYGLKNSNSRGDFAKLCELTVEIKAITKQAILLHGERIKRAQNLFKNYKEGAFSAWLTHTYGNRQTPYNLLLYFELYQKLTAPLRTKLESLPRQAAYTLASRKGPHEQKTAIIENYRGETKDQLLKIIRKAFPLDRSDRRIGRHPLVNQLKTLLRSLREAKLEGLGKDASKEVAELLRACQRAFSQI